MKTYLGTVSAGTLALFLATGVAVSQEKQAPERPGASSGAERSNSGSQSPAREQAPDRGRSGGDASPGRSGAAQGQSSGAEGRAAPQSRESQKAETPDRGKGATKDRSAAERKEAPNRTAEPRAKDNEKRAEPKAKDTGKRAADPKAGDTQQRAEPKAKDTQQRAEPKAKDNEKRAAEPNAKRNDDRASGDRSGGSTNVRVDISPDQREGVRTVFRDQNLRRTTNVNVNIEIGRRLPRTVTLYNLPPRIVEIVPSYRSYRYIYVGNRIAIVDPGSYEIVYVLDSDAGSGNRVQSAALDLSASERTILLDLIDFSQHRADFGFRLALGAEVPARVELYRFPTNVLDRMPKLDGYRYVVVDRSLLIVDPSDRQIELVIESR